MRREKSALNQNQRAQAIVEMQREDFDILVVGGGVTGAGIALDAATRGLKVALIEKGDFAEGTSSRSSKLIHGGLRYLEQYDFKLVREALKERELMVKYQAPHLVKPLSFIYPLQGRVRERTYVGAGLALYDALRGAQRTLPNHRHLTGSKMAAVAPCLNPDLITGGIEYFDAQVDDARHTMTVIRTAAMYGARIANRVEAMSLQRHNARVIGAKVRDLHSGAEFNIAAKATIMATGVWSNPLNEAFGIKASYQVKMSKGVHILVPKNALELETGLIIKTAISVLFVIPWQEHWLIGTTDTEYLDDRDQPDVTESDIEYILRELNRVLKTPLAKSAIVGSYAGLRPLVSPAPDASTTKISREHTIDTPEPGFVSIAGGKYTTYRIMAEDAVNSAQTWLQRELPASVTKAVPILGGEGYVALANNPVALAKELNLTEEVTLHLLNRYGSEIFDLSDLIKIDTKLGERIHESIPYLWAEISYAISHEGAMTLNDILHRRTRIAFEYPQHSKEVINEFSQFVGARLGWSPDQRTDEINKYLSSI